MSFPYYKFSGSREQVATDTAQALQPLAYSLYSFRKKNLQSLEESVPFEEANWQEIYDIHKASTPYSAVEAQACGDVHSVHPGQWLVMSGMSDWLDFLQSRQTTDLGCSTLLFPPNQSKIPMVQTWDLHRFVENHSVVLERHVEGMVPSLTLTTALGHAHFGVNAEGICIGTNNLQCKRARKGVVFAAAIQEVLDRATSIQKAIEILQQLPLMSGHNFILADKNKNVVNLERSTYQSSLFSITQKSFAHTNHFLTEHLIEEGIVYSSTSIPRCEYLQGKAKQGMESGSLSQFQDWFSDHSVPVCRHGKKPDDIVTCALVAFHPEIPGISLIKGRACSGKWTRYSL